MPDRTKYILYYDSTKRPLADGRNAEFDEALEFARGLHGRGAPVEIVDTAQPGHYDLNDAYLEAVSASVYKQYPIRQVFGSKKHSGWLFGRGVPALLVYTPEKRFPEDVYPHGSWDQICTIRDFLRDFEGELGN